MRAVGYNDNEKNSPLAACLGRTSGFAPERRWLCYSRHMTGFDKYKHQAFSQNTK
jgi:hypothetical protein